MKFKDLSQGGGKNYLRMNPGESVRGVFRGEVSDFRQHWINNRGVICEGYDKCQPCQDGEKSAFRFMINFVIQENGAYVAKTFQQGRAVYEALKALHEDYDLEKNQMKITRHGKGTDTTYAIVPVPNGTLNAAQEKSVKAVQLNEFTTPGQPANEDTGEEAESEEVAFLGKEMR